MINELIKLANHLDQKGYSKEADYIDSLVKRAQLEQSEVADMKGQYQVRRGDSWARITKKHSPGRSPAENAALNGMTVDDIIHPCQMLEIWTTPEYGGSLESMNPDCR